MRSGICYNGEDVSKYCSSLLMQEKKEYMAV